MPVTGVPEGFTVFDKKMPGRTIRVAFDVEDVKHDLTETGYTLSDDQTSPVYRVMVKSKSMTHYPIAGIPKDVSEDIAKKVVEDLGFSGKANLVFEFVTASKDLLTQGKVPDHVAEYRLTVCTGLTKDGDKVSKKCPNYVNENGRRGSGHCKGCGCPEWGVAEMDRPGKILPGKVWYPMGCPKGRFAAMPGRRADAT